MTKNTILCLHGAFLGGYLFDPLREALELQIDANIKLYSPTLLGHGNDYTKELTYVKQAAWLEKKYGHTKPILLGHSMGAGIALQCALQWRSPPEALFLCGAGIGRPMGPNTTQGFLARGIKPSLTNDFIRQMSEGWFYTTTQELIDGFRRQILNLSKDQFEEIQASLSRGIDQMGRSLEDLQIKTIILHGKEDQNRSLKEAQELSTYLNGELVILEECGHMVPVERVEVLAQKIAFEMRWRLQ